MYNTGRFRKDRRILAHWCPLPALQRHNTENSQKIFNSPNFHTHVSVSDVYIPTIGLPILLQKNMWTHARNI
jgi:hypothetical protein